MALNRRSLLAGAGILAVGGVGAAELFAPERSTRRAEDLDDDSATVYGQGQFEGKAGHSVSGTVELRERNGQLELAFGDFEQTQGPDVYCYLTPAPDPDTAAEIDAGTKVPVPDGADDGELTLEGSFTVPVPAAVDPTAVSGVASWCDDFGVPFGAATLRSP